MEFLKRTPSGTGNSQIFTLSTWIKRGIISQATGSLNIFESRPGSYFIYCFTSVATNGGDFIRFEATGGMNLGVDLQFRDPSAWYHVVTAVDTTQSTASNRVKFYVNGEQRGLNTSHTTYPSQNASFTWNSNVVQCVGGSSFSNSEGFDGYLADTYNIDGQQLTAASFGETDSTTGIWIPKTYSGSYGTNGFRLQYKNAAALGTDTSGQGNNFTPQNMSADNQVKDTPDNNFCTLNPLDQSNSYGQTDVKRGVFSEGNCNFSSNGTIGGSERYYNTTSTMAIPPSGKWYWEAKPNNGTNGLGFRWTMGLLASNHGYSNASFGEWTEAIGQRGSYAADGQVRYNNSQVGSTYTAASVNDIISFKYDSDNRNLYVAINGTYINSGNAVLTSSNITATDFLLIFLQNGSDGDVATAMNFGNPPFTISSGNADANGYGNFEYAVPSGYYALCTKNLNTYG